jgi:cyclin C
MASNYWDSTQAKFWTFTKPELAEIRQDLETANQSTCSRHVMPDRRLMNIYFQQQLLRLARRMSIRQQALATAQVYIKRFYLRVEIRRTNPYLIMATAVYLACKMEECPQHIRIMLGEAARQWPELGINEASKIGECEFAMISTLSSRLICHHPYRPLLEFAPLFGLSPEEIQLAQSILNDSYNTDLILLHPPHVLAVTSIFLMLVSRALGQTPGHAAHAMPPSPLHLQSPGGSLSGISSAFHSPALNSSSREQVLANLNSLSQARPKIAKLIDWVAESKIDIGAVIEATQELISLYSVWESYNERACKEAITKFMKEGNGMAGGVK